MHATQFQQKKNLPAFFSFTLFVFAVLQHVFCMCENNNLLAMSKNIQLFVHLHRYHTCVCARCSRVAICDCICLHKFRTEVTISTHTHNSPCFLLCALFPHTRSTSSPSRLDLPLFSWLLSKLASSFFGFKKCVH